MKRTGTLKAPGSINASSLTDQYQREEFGSALLWAPTHKKPTRIITLIKSYLMEYLFSTVFYFLVIFSVVSAVASSADLALRTLLVALVSGGSYYMGTGWLRRPAEELPRHGGWLVTIAYTLVLRFGVIHALIYLSMHTLGALTASGLLSAFGPGLAGVEVWLPQYTDTTARGWAAEIIGAALIVFSLLYNHMAGASSGEEDEHQREGETMASVMRAVAVVVFFRLGNWTFEPALYLAGLFATCWNGGCLSSTNATHYSAGFFIGVPMIGMVVAVALYILGVVLSADYGMTVRRGKGGRMPPESAERQVHTQYSKVSTD